MLCAYWNYLLVLVHLKRSDVHGVCLAQGHVFTAQLERCWTGLKRDYLSYKLDKNMLR